MPNFLISLRRIELLSVLSSREDLKYPRRGRFTKYETARVLDSGGEVRVRNLLVHCVVFLNSQCLPSLRSMSPSGGGGGGEGTGARRFQSVTRICLDD